MSPPRFPTASIPLLLFGLGMGCGPGQLSLGQPCEVNVDCRFPLCIDGTCSSACDETDDCLDDMVCEERTVDSDEIVGACVPLPQGSCIAPGDCDAGQTCLAHRGSTTLAFTCGSDHPLHSPLGDSCGVDDECRSNLCHDGRCSAPCASDLDCASDLELSCESAIVHLASADIRRDLCVGPPVCQSDADCDGGSTCQLLRGRDTIFVLCAPGHAGLESGAACVSDHDCASGLCEDSCLAPCETDDDCLGQTCGLRAIPTDTGSDHASVCVNVDDLTCTSDNDCSLPDVCMAQRQADGLVMACGTINTQGAVVGHCCQQDAHCARNLCVAGTCAEPCSAGDACGAVDVVCRSHEVPVDQGFVVARLCMVATACTSESDCSGGDTCVIGEFPNVSSTTVCLPRDPNKRTTGMACTTDDQCQSNFCLDTDQGRQCSEPCEASGDCWLNDWACEARPVGGTTELWAHVCVPPPPVVTCEVSSDCWESGGVCGDIRFNQTSADPIEKYCVAPKSGGANMGETCTGSVALNLSCHDRVCLAGVSNGCSTPCQTDADCSRTATGFLCTDLSYAPGARFCIESCSRDGDCPGGHACAISVNETDDRYDFVCRLPAGEMEAGTDCSLENDCAHGLCLTRNQGATVIEKICTRPCSTDADCPSDTSMWDWHCVDSIMSTPASGTDQIARVCTRAAL